MQYLLLNKTSLLLAEYYFNSNLIIVKINKLKSYQIFALDQVETVTLEHSTQGLVNNQSKIGWMDNDETQTKPFSGSKLTATVADQHESTEETRTKLTLTIDIDERDHTLERTAKGSNAPPTNDDNTNDDSDKRGGTLGFINFLMVSIEWKVNQTTTIQKPYIHRDAQQEEK